MPSSLEQGDHVASIIAAAATVVEAVATVVATRVAIRGINSSAGDKPRPKVESVGHPVRAVLLHPARGL